MYQKIGIIAVLASVLLSAALLATPMFKVANAQENQTQGNQTQGLNVDKWIVVLKKSNPTLNDIQQSSDVKDAIGKIKAMQDPQEAVKTLNALGALQQLMNIKSVNEAQ
jgi:guanyl-specific ribonuclease Sa